MHTLCNHTYVPHTRIHIHHSTHTSGDRRTYARIYPAGHVTATQPSHALQTIYGKMQVSQYLGPVVAGSNTTSLELSAIQRDTIINGLLFPLNNMTDCAYNASCFDAGSKGPVSNFLRAPTSFRIITPDVVTHKQYMYIHSQIHTSFRIITPDVVTHKLHMYIHSQIHTYSHMRVRIM